MITYNKDTKIFHLSNEQISYVFQVNSIGFLVKLYFGRKIHDFTADEIKATSSITGDSYQYYSLKEEKEYDLYDPFFSKICQPEEVPAYLSLDKRPPLVKIKHGDGSCVTDFRYETHEIIKGKPPVFNLPCVSAEEDECETLIVTLKDRKSDIYLSAFYTIFKHKNVIVRHNEIINKSNETVYLQKAASLCLDLPTNDYVVTYVHGAYANDRALEETPILHSNVLIEENAGGKGFHHNPVGMIKRTSTNETSGEAIGFGLIYSSNFTISFTGTQFNSTRMVIGINEENFNWVMSNNSVFYTPEAFLVYSDNGTDEITNSFHDLIRDNILRKFGNLPQNVILLNSWEGTYFDFNTDKIMSYVDKAIEMGANLVVLDDGWFGKRNDDKSSLGDWWVNEDKIDLKKVVEYAHSKGIKFGLWVEPEMVNPDSDLYRKHPEFALFDRTIDPCLGRNQMVLDMTNPTVVDYLYEKLENIFSTYKLDYCKWDFNRYLSEPVSTYLEPEHQGEVFHRFMLGTYKLLTKFTNRFPDLLLETCAGGGGRFDLGMLSFSSQIWGSDETDGISRTFIQYATNMFYPLRCIGSHVSARKFLSISEKAAIAMFGTYGYELNPNLLSEKEFKEIKECNNLFLRNKKIIDEGNYYSLINPFKNPLYVSWEVCAKDQSQAVVLFMNYRLVDWESRFLKLKGLDPNKQYKNTLDNKIYHGDFYMNVGLNLCDCRNNFSPIVIELVSVDAK